MNRDQLDENVEPYRFSVNRQDELEDVTIEEIDSESISPLGKYEREETNLTPNRESKEDTPFAVLAMKM